jgi:hypothetical protein
MLAAASVAAIQPAASAAGFGAHWALNEKSGPVIDSSGNHNDGTVHGGVTRTGSKYDFDGKSGYISVPNSASLNPGAAAFEFTVRFSLDGNPPHGDYDIVRKGLAGTKGGDYKMEVLASGKALCRFHGTTAAVLEGGTNLGNGTHTVSCIKDADQVRLVVDGSTKASKSVHVGSISNNQPVILAAKPGDDYTSGLIDDVSLT